MVKKKLRALITEKFIIRRTSRTRLPLGLGSREIYNLKNVPHSAPHMNKAIDKVRTTEVKSLKAKGKKAVLTGSRWCLLKRPENCTENQATKLQELVAINLKTVRAYLLVWSFL
jgi:hypothetical protein